VSAGLRTFRLTRRTRHPACSCFVASSSATAEQASIAPAGPLAPSSLDEQREGILDDLRGDPPSLVVLRALSRRGPDQPDQRLSDLTAALLPDLPLERDPSPGPHQPTGVDRCHYKVLFTHARTYMPRASARRSS
jgi:hypothetical protein